MSYFLFSFIVLIFGPGILGAKVDARLSMEDSPHIGFILIIAYLYGVFANVVVGVFYVLLANFDWFNMQLVIVDVIEIALASRDESLTSEEYVFSNNLLVDLSFLMPTSIVLAVFWFKVKTSRWVASLFPSNRKMLNRAQMVFQYGNGSSLPPNNIFREVTEKSNLVRITDHNHGYTVQGLIENFALHKKYKEFLLKEVTVSRLVTDNDESNKLEYTVPYLYLSFPMENVRIEFPKSE